VDSIAGANANDIDIVEQALENDDFRQVLMTGPNLQLAAMTVPVGESLGTAARHGSDRVLFLVEGYADVTLEGRTTAADAGHLVFVPAGVEHDVVNTGDDPLRLVALAAPPEHEPGIVHRTRGEAEAVDLPT